MTETEILKDTADANAPDEKKGYCIKCGVSTESDRAHCPVCGKCVNEDLVGKPRTFDYYPKYIKWKRTRQHVMLGLTILLIIVNLIWFGFELGFSHKLDIYWYFLASSLALFVVIIWPLIQRVNYLTKSVAGVTAISGLLIFIDAFSIWQIHRGNSDSGLVFGWSACVAVPMVLMGYAIFIGVTMMLRGYYGRSALYPSLWVAVCATVLFVLNFSVFSDYNVFWPSIVILAVSWGIMLFLFITRYRKIVSGIKKDFHM